jgi:hypothetical protein
MDLGLGADPPGRQGRSWGRARATNWTEGCNGVRVPPSYGLGHRTGGITTDPATAHGSAGRDGERACESLGPDRRSADRPRAAEKHGRPRRERRIASDATVRGSFWISRATSVSQRGTTSSWSRTTSSSPTSPRAGGRSALARGEGQAAGPLTAMRGGSTAPRRAVRRRCAQHSRSAAPFERSETRAAASWWRRCSRTTTRRSPTSSRSQSRAGHERETGSPAISGGPRPRLAGFSD